MVLCESCASGGSGRCSQTKLDPPCLIKSIHNFSDDGVNNGIIIPVHRYISVAGEDAQVRAASDIVGDNKRILCRVVEEFRDA